MVHKAGVAAKLAVKSMQAMRDELNLGEVPMMSELASFSGGKIRTEHRAIFEIKLSGNAVKHHDKKERRQLVDTANQQIRAELTFAKSDLRRAIRSR